AQPLSRARAVLPPVVGEREDGRRPVVRGGEVVPQRLDQVRIEDAEESPGLNARRLDRLIANVVGVKRYPLVLLGENRRPDLLRREGIEILEPRRGDSWHDDDRRLHVRVGRHDDLLTGRGAEARRPSSTAAGEMN